MEGALDKTAMTYFSILDLEQPKANASRSGFFWDLNLNQIIDCIQQQSPQYNIAELYYRFPADETCVEYRRKIYGEVKQAEVYECLRAFSEGMRKAAASEGNKEAAKTELQRKAWYVNAAHSYCTAVSGLQEALSRRKLRSEGLRRLSEYLDNYTGQQIFRKCREEAASIQRTMEELHLILEIEDNRIVITQGRRNGSYAKKLGCGENVKIPSPFLGMRGMSPLEEAIFDAFRRKNPLETLRFSPPLPGALKGGRCYFTLIPAARMRSAIRSSSGFSTFSSLSSGVERSRE